MIFKNNCRYRHSNPNASLDIYVVKVRYQDDDKAKLRIFWIQRHNGKVATYPGCKIDGTENIKIQGKDYINWSIYE